MNKLVNVLKKGVEQIVDERNKSGHVQSESAHSDYRCIVYSAFI